MDIILETIFETEWGIIFLCGMLILCIIIEFFNNKPKC